MSNAPRDVGLSQFASDDALAATAATEWWSYLGPLCSQSRPISVALSGGRIANKFYASIVSQTPPSMNYRRLLHFFWADERCVPPNHDDCNYRVARELLASPLGIPDAQLHRIQGELPPQQAAEHAEKDLRHFHSNVQPRLTSLETPMFDLIILGMGEDGHIASLFPGDDWEDRNTPPLYRSVVATKPPPNRVTMTYRILQCAAEVWVLASGKGKSDALNRSLLTQETPLGKLRSLRERIRIFSDIQ